MRKSKPPWSSNKIFNLAHLRSHHSKNAKNKINTREHQEDSTQNYSITRDMAQIQSKQMGRTNITNQDQNRFFIEHEQDQYNYGGHHPHSLI
jgi:peptidase E